jgi:hypothetical protein
MSPNGKIGHIFSGNQIALSGHGALTSIYRCGRSPSCDNASSTKSAPISTVKNQRISCKTPMPIRYLSVRSSLKRGKI